MIHRDEIHKDEELSWQQQAEIFQDALEAALEHNRDLEWTNESQESQLQYFLREMPALRARHQAELQRKDTAIQELKKDLDQLRFILQIQQRLLRLHIPNTRQS